MFDRIALKITKPLVDATARQIVMRGLSADQVTLVCFALGMLSVVLIMLGQFHIALVPLLLGRICDGLDGAVARQTVQTDRGAFMDIALDFVFYASVPLSFALLLSCSQPSSAPARAFWPMPRWQKSAARKVRLIRQSHFTIWVA
jgi:phosphatidylserine synthase